MQFLAITRRHVDRFSEEQFAEVLGPEGARAKELFAAGSFRMLYSRGDVPGAVIEVEAADAAEAAALIESLPFAQRGMMAFEIIPLKPYRGFVP